MNQRPTNPAWTARGTAGYKSQAQVSEHLVRPFKTKTCMRRGAFLQRVPSSPKWSDAGTMRRVKCETEVPSSLVTPRLLVALSLRSARKQWDGTNLYAVICAPHRCLRTAAWEGRGCGIVGCNNAHML